MEESTGEDTEEVTERSLLRSKSIHRRTGRTFYFATKLLPERVRHATYVLYAFFRVADEVVDDPGDASPAEQRERLVELRDAALGRVETDDDVVRAFRTVRERYDIPDREVELFIDAMLTDIDTDRYPTYDDLEAYMRGSAGAVGVMMTYVMDPEDIETALPSARALGEAFQLTNFLRDVGEDMRELDRVYLPRTTLTEHDVDPERIERLEMSPEIAAAIESELQRAEGLYRRGVAGIRYLPRDCQLPVLTAAVLYADHHRLIRKHAHDTVTTTPSLGTLRKLWLISLTRWHWFRTGGDPMATFARVSSIPTGAAVERSPERSDPVPTR